MYDWANSAFHTTVVTTLVGPYLTDLAQRDVGSNGIVLPLGPFGAVTALSLFPFCIAVAALLQVVLLPILGAVADQSGKKKRLMAMFCYIGVAATCFLYSITDDRYLLGGVLLIVASFASGVTLVVYNAFLNDLVAEDQRDKVSSQGYAVGYLGGGLLLAANLALLLMSDRIGISTAQAVRLSLLSAGLWWGGFALIAFARLPSRPAAIMPSTAGSPPVRGLSALAELWTELKRLRHTRRYLVAYTAFNSGIQTVIAVASVFLAQELFVARGLPTNQTFLMGLVLMVQFVAAVGALTFGRVAALLTTKRAILVSLVIWTGVVTYAYGVLQTVGQAWVMGAVLALVLGGSQALSRSLFSQMTPPGHAAGFFSLYEVTERGSAWIGPFLFGLIASLTGSYRQAILSLVLLFVLGIIVLVLTDTDRAIREAAQARTPTDRRAR